MFLLFFCLKNKYLCSRNMEESIITSVQNARVKHVVALQQKSSLRREERLFVVEGQREIEHCVACGYEIVEVFRKGENVTPQVYEKMAYRESTEGIIAIAKCKEHNLSNLSIQSNRSPLIIVLERVEKPGNLGAIPRTAEAAGVDAVIVCDPLTDLFNTNLIRSSLGAFFTVPCVACTSAECIAFLKQHGVQILTAQLQDSRLYYDTDMRCATAIVMGTESTGLSPQWRQAADAHIRIPMLGRVDSLNVSVSAAILVFEAVRQRRAVE
jgi:TrmH family RNA methyltransferase